MLRLDMFKQLSKYAFVGVSGTLIHLLVLYILVEFVNSPYQVGAVLGGVVAMTNCFYWNKRWTFINKEHSFKKQYAKYTFVTLVGLGLNVIVLTLLVEIGNLWYMLSQVAAIGLVGFNTFIFNKYWTFRE